MDIWVLDQDLKSVAVIDGFISFLWVDRYCGFGDFEIFAAPTVELLNVCQMDNYIYLPQSDRVMIIDERVLESDVESGNTITIRGRSLDSILERRIMWEGMTFDESFQDAIHRILNENVINPSNPDRRISNFVFQASTDPRILEMTLVGQITSSATGANVYSTIVELCEERKLGFKIVLNDQNQFVFSLYMGVDRSYAQEANPYVIFSPNFDNVINSNYLESDKLLRSVALVAGEAIEDDVGRRTTILGGGSGLARRELFIDARDIRTNVGADDTPRVDLITGTWFIADGDTEIKWQAFRFVDSTTSTWFIGTVNTGIKPLDNPHIDPETNTWVINDVDTRITSSVFPRADTGTSTWVIDDIDTRITVQDMPNMHITTGYWFIGEVSSGIRVQDVPYVNITTGTWFIGTVNTGIASSVVPRVDSVTDTWFFGNVDAGITSDDIPYASVNNGTWFIGTTNTRITVVDVPRFSIATGTWFIGDVDTKITSSTLASVSANTNTWYIGTVDTGIIFQEYLDSLEYTEHLIQRGNERLAEYVSIKTFEGDVEVTQTFKYGEDFFLGDIVQIVNEFGIEASSQIVEIVSSFDDSGENIVPTFSVIT